MRFVFLGFISGLILLVGCQTGATHTQSSPTVTQAVKEVYCDPGGFDLEHNRMTDSTEFPFVYQGPDNTLYFAAYDLRFSLTYEDPLYPKTNSQVKFIDGSQFSEINGNFITFVRNGREVSLQNPYIMVQYIQKSDDNTRTPEAVYNWLDSLMMTRPGTQIGDFYTLPTLGQNSAVCREYFIQPSQHPTNQMMNRAAKQIAYAYVDISEDYMIGITLTTVIETDFPISLPLFQNLVKSMCY